MRGQHTVYPPRPIDTYKASLEKGLKKIDNLTTKLNASIESYEQACQQFNALVEALLSKNGNNGAKAGRGKKK